MKIVTVLWLMLTTPIWSYCTSDWIKLYKIKFSLLDGIRNCGQDRRNAEWEYLWFITFNSICINESNPRFATSMIEASSLKEHEINLTKLCGMRPPLWSSGQSSWLHKGDLLCFLWGTNWIYICYVEESRFHCKLQTRILVREDALGLIK
jgi:hypothetical protein